MTHTKERGLLVTGILVLLGVSALGAATFRAQLERMQRQDALYTVVTARLNEIQQDRLQWFDSSDLDRDRWQWFDDVNMAGVLTQRAGELRIRQVQIRNQYFRDARRFSWLLVAPFAILQALYLVLSGRAASHVRVFGSTAAMGGAMALLIALPLSLAWLLSAFTPEAIFLALVVGVFLPLRWFLLAAPLVATRRTCAMDAFATSARVLHPHAAGLRRVLQMAAVLLYIGATLACQWSTNRIEAGEVRPSALDVALLAAPGIVTLTILIMASEHYLGRVRRDLSTIVDADMRRIFD